MSDEALRALFGFEETPRRGPPVNYPLPSVEELKTIRRVRAAVERVAREPKPPRQGVYR